MYTDKHWGQPWPLPHMYRLKARAPPIIGAYMRDKPEGKVHHTLKLTHSFHHLLVWLIWVTNPPGTCSRSLCLCWCCLQLDAGPSQPSHLVTYSLQEWLYRMWNFTLPYHRHEGTQIIPTFSGGRRTQSSENFENKATYCKHWANSYLRIYEARENGLR